MGEQAVGLLQALGYERLRLYAGGMADWTEHRGPVEGTPVAEVLPAGRTRPAQAPEASRRKGWIAPIEALGDRPMGYLLLLWVWMVVGFGLIYWVAGAWQGYGLRAGEAFVQATWEGLVTALYFSFVTALSIGYGDVVPVGPVRLLAIVEGAAALLIFGIVISKLVSRHQEELTEEIHRITFEDRLGRVRTNLHLVLSEFQAIAGMGGEPGARRERILSRVESAAVVFAGELQTVHDLLYRPQQTPDEQVLESILANLCAVLRELNDLLASLAEAPKGSPTLRRTLRSTAALANEICGECVPRAYAPGLKAWMDQIQGLARQIA
ncbi:MAG: potassium channel family protein [candidate division NC10 bacterium]|nr:potassium channel family protein [candidate division NC10 bacterium]